MNEQVTAVFMGQILELVSDDLADQVGDGELDELQLRLIETALESLPKAMYAQPWAQRLNKRVATALETLEPCDDCGFDPCRCVRKDADWSAICYADPAWMD